MTDEYKELFSRQPGHHKQRILYKATPTVQTVDVARCAEQRQVPQKSGTSELYSTKLNIYRLLKTATRKTQTRSKIRRAQSGAEKPSSRARTENEQKIPSQDVQARKVA